MDKKIIILVEHDNIFPGELENAIKLIGKKDEYSVIFSCPKKIPIESDEIVKSFTSYTINNIKKFNEDIEGILVDIRIKGERAEDEKIKDKSGILIASNLKKIFPKIPVILVTDHWGASDLLTFSKATLEFVDGVLPKKFFFGNEFTDIAFEDIFKKAKLKSNFRIQCNEKAEKAIEAQNNIKADIAVITALIDPEFKTFKEYFSGLKKIDKNSYKFPDTTNYYFKTFKISGKNINLVAATDDRMGLPASTSLATRIINQFNPRFIIILGIAAGIKTNVGDILIAEYSFDYGSGKNEVEEKNGQKQEVFKPYHKPYALNEGMRKDISDLLEKDDKKILHSIKSKTKNIFVNDKELQYYIQPFASGAAVIANKNIVYDINAQEGKLIGFDMEAYGVFYAANNCNSDTEAISIKAVSDLGTEEKSTELKKQHQLYAAHNSVLAFKYILENILVNEIYSC